MLSTRKFNANHRKKERRGVTSVEFAVTLPVLLLLIALVFESSRVLMVQQCLSYAAQQGCRTASLATTLSDAQVETATRAAMQIAIPNNAAVVDVVVTPTLTGGMSSGTSVSVDVDVNLSDVAWMPGNLVHYVGDPVLSSRAVLDRE